MGRKPKGVGLEMESAHNVSASLSTAADCGFNFICIPLAHPTLRRSIPGDSVDPFLVTWARTDLVIPGADWQNRIVPKISTWLNLDSPNEASRRNAEEILQQEFNFVHHLGCRAVIVELYRRDNPNLARQLHSRLFVETSTYFKEDIWLQIPTTSKATSAACNRNDVTVDDDDEDKDDPWHWWNDLRLQCESHCKLKVALELTADLPDDQKLSRWLGEPIDLLIIPTSLFLTNKGGYPALSKPHQRFVQKVAVRNVTVLITGGNRHSAYKHYVQYVSHLYQTAEIEPHLVATSGFEDSLQMPLQPLADHLESYTYETFEKDPVKYTEYGNAVYQALLDRVPEEEADKNTQVIMVVGAGRGPLVTQCIVAAQNAKRKIRVYALDKNPNAIVALVDLKKVNWGDVVTVVHCDMRKWKAPEKCDILVSELLGSFGDNELSPECLDGAQIFMKDDAISIPESYRSYIHPTMSMRLYNEARDLRLIHKPDYVRFEHTYVVAQANIYPIAPPQLLYEFVHPNLSPVIDNSRYKKLKFAVSEDCTLYGFTGYFDTTLYKDVKLSILPETYSVGMFSWYPLYIPIMNPIICKKGDTVVLHFWRRHDEKRVWYEWCVTSPACSGIHNINGRSSTIGL